jgi:hypothetical protein
MKAPRHQSSRTPRATLAELVAVVNKLTHNERLAAYIVADLINTQQVHIEGQFHGRRIVVA